MDCSLAEQAPEKITAEKYTDARCRARKSRSMWAHARVVAAGAMLTAGLAGAYASPRHGNRSDVLPAVAIVPEPAYVQVNDAAYVWPSRVRVRATAPEARDAAELARAYLAENGVTATVITAPAGADVVIAINTSAAARLGPEGYSIAVSRGEIAIAAGGPPGLFYAVQTLQQISARSGGGLLTRAVTIVDRPAYRWRGIHLDVARHFFSVPVIERYIDVAAHYKLNVFHWHLTDDQAWRLESRRYPRLTEGIAHYSRDDVRRIVAYAAHRYVTVVPEIDLPAHTTAALRAYPRLACAHETLCTSAAGLAFARTVLDEAMAEFASPYVHTGGDEFPAPLLAAQPRFTTELERYVESRGRRFAAWDDVLTPQLSARALLTVWTSPKRAAAAAARGNDVVLATGALHFDSAQGDPAQEPRASPHVATLEQVYDYGVMPRGLAATARSHVIGAQANVWTERIATPEHLFSMTLPRELALAENAWTPRSRKSWNSFLARLPAQFSWLAAHRYPFRIPNAAFAVGGDRAIFEAVPGHLQSVRAWTAAPAVAVTLRVPLGGAVIRYTTDGSAPTASSRAYQVPFVLPALTSPIVLRAAPFFHGRSGAISECIVIRTSAAGLRVHHNAAKTWSALVSP